MATGDNNDILARLKSVIPPWFSQATPVLDAVLSTFAQIGSWGYGLLQFVKLQARVATATDIFLDLIAFDFFGFRVRRKASQLDADFRTVISNEVLRERGTRAGMLKALLDLTGSPARMFEVAYPYDTGGFDTFALGFDISGGWGSNDLPYQNFINVVQPIGAGVPLVAGYDTGYGAWDGGFSSLIDANSIRGKVTDQDIYDTIEATRTAGVTYYVNIGQPTPPIARLGIEFILGSSQLYKRTLQGGIGA